MAAKLLGPRKISQICSPEERFGNRSSVLATQEDSGNFLERYGSREQLGLQLLF